MEIRDGRRWLSALLSSAVNFAVITLMLGGWLFSLQTICDVTANGGILFICSVLLALVSATLFALPAMPRRIGIGFLILGAALTLWRWEPLLPGLQELLSRVSTPLSTLFPALALPQTDASASELFPCVLFLAALMALMLGFFTWARCWWAAMTVCFLPFLPSVLAGTMPSWPGIPGYAGRLSHPAVYRAVPAGGPPLSGMGPPYLPGYVGSAAAPSGSSASPG